MITYNLSTSGKKADISYDMSDAIRFSATRGMERRQWTVQNNFFRGAFTEFRGRKFNIVRSHIHCTSDCCLWTRHNGTSFLSLGLVQKGNVEFEQGNDRYTWKQSESNILIGADYHDEYNFFQGGHDFEMTNLVISPFFFHDLAERYPDIFGLPFQRMENGETFFLSPYNILQVPCLNECLLAICRAEEWGNCSEMYLEAKIQEALSLFITSCETGRQTMHPTTFSAPVEEKMQHIRSILQEEYSASHSLHELARRVGTNECTLKSAFRQFFHQTVFSYLFDYRMQMASSFLLDTDKTITEIAPLVGYEHASHFCIAFKRKYGISPLEFRKAKLQRNNNSPI